MKKLGLMAAGMLLGMGLIAYAASSGDDRKKEVNASCDPVECRQATCDPASCDTADCMVLCCPESCEPRTE